MGPVFARPIKFPEKINLIEAVIAVAVPHPV